MRVLMIAHFTDGGDMSNNRFSSLAGTIARRGAEVELVTSSFLHRTKTQRDTSAPGNPLFTTTYVNEPAYRGNVSVGRLRSHRVLGRSLADYLRKRSAPDVVYCAVPSLEVASAATDFAKRHGVRLILDVQDLWPEAFEMVLRPRWAARCALAPLRIHADRIYRAADAVVTVSETYSQRVAEARDDGAEVTTVYLGTDLRRFDSYLPKRPPEAGFLELAYVGTLGHSYDLPAVFDALRALRRDGHRMRLHVMGSGPFEGRWRHDTQDLPDEVVFHGRLDYPEMVSRLRGCDIAVNPIVPGSAGSIINKVGDYAAAGLPVVNSQECEEYRALLDAYGAGISCAPTSSAIASALAELASDPLLGERGQGSRRMAEERFDRGVTYERLGEMVLDAR
ncbi:glycosyltransferase involved in cell wall biosynthesis [Brevibacterium sanguinis]|uniref:Glycosyltransferase involved in cell wall biosynthesis n=2 Tax=Brevibacterium TaxID=1696 RepID=A0A366IPE8_9MICO|nr:MULTISPECIES: glycosyltransferase family 4 protein [Brevibacterium]RBP66968.1 glycosyltransferase involved in cell wall biosynthesis [Brevibacterium sanguinis]RBP73493.1 glycosyltransferase involved in cell wall biosynthesis [Brevibacterium celere]